MIPYYQDEFVTLYRGECQEVLASGAFNVDAVIADPPYGETSFKWDRYPTGWHTHLPASASSMWMFGSLALLLDHSHELRASAWRLAQDVVWEKHNGSNNATDRFRRVHELATHWYRGRWADVYKDPQVEHTATRRTVRRSSKPAHWNGIGDHEYRSEDGGPRMMRSVLQVRSCHGYAVHPTQKPLALVLPLLQYSVPLGGTVLDPFAGSGTTLLAARQSGRRAIGIEADTQFCDAIVERLSQQMLTLDGAPVS